ncbi:uncharacterized protein LOC115926092 [Strongylocentrotus purpuratus]|uniref:Uncharacterized protein n=1 Tax=Strongylocentrotus purpuratus TaxID=7668 RepID=A0A7M7P646_STRPU|nr:uncharacterized protein LOC115926092 [Strongylocentrotus purpuratus]
MTSKLTERHGADSCRPGWAKRLHPMCHMAAILDFKWPPYYCDETCLCQLDCDDEFIDEKCSFVVPNECNDTCMCGPGDREGQDNREIVCASTTPEECEKSTTTVAAEHGVASQHPPASTITPVYIRHYTLAYSYEPSCTINIVEATLNGRRPVTAILPTPVTRIEELRLEILSIDTEDSGSLRVDFLGCMEVVTTTTQTSTSTTAGYCMEPMDGEQGLESSRSTTPASEDQSTDINADKPWIFELQSNLRTTATKTPNWTSSLTPKSKCTLEAPGRQRPIPNGPNNSIVEATLNGRRPVTAILPTPVTRIEELRLEILSIDREDSGSLRVDFLGCMEGYCMEPMDGEQGLESSRSTTPASEDQSTDINADKPWIFELQSNPEDNRDQNPKLDIVEATLNGRRPVTAILPTPVTRIEELRLEILSIDREDSGSLRVDFLGCMEVVTTTTQTSTSTTDTVWSQWTASKDLRVAVLQLRRPEDQSTDINADKPWIFELQSNPEDNRDQNPNWTSSLTPKSSARLEAPGRQRPIPNGPNNSIVEATLNGRRPVTAILPTPVTRIEELRLEILSIDTEDSGSLRVDFLGCMEEITTTTPAATTTKGYCMEPMDGEQGLESSRSTTPASEDQSTDINADKPWIFELQSNPEDNRDQNPKLDVKFNTEVQVHALKLQGDSDQSQTIVEATLNGRRPVTAILPTPVTRIEELRLEIFVTTTTQTSTSTTAGYCMEPMDGEQGLESIRSSTPASEDQSTDINADKPWTFELQSNPEDNRDQNPKLDVKFNTEVQVHALKLQGDSDQSQTVRIIPLVRDRSTQIYTDVLDSSGKPLIVEATLNGRRPVTAILPTPVTRIEELRLEILSIDTEDSGSLRVDFLGCMEVVTTTTQTSTSTTIVEATLNGRRPVTAILPTPVTRIEELRLEILSIDTEDSGSLRVDFLGCMEVVTTTTQTSTSTTAGYCMEPMDGEQGLESSRSTTPASEDQSTDINADKPWIFELQSNPEDNRDQNPKLDVKFNTEVQVHALKLQGDSDQSQTVRIIPLVRDRSTQIYTDVLDSSGKPLIVEATLNGRRPVTAILPTPVTRIEELRLEILSIDTEDSGSLRVDFLGCMEVVTTTTQTSTSTTAGYCMEPMDGEQGLESIRSSTPASEDQSTDINADKPWTFELQSNPEDNRDQNPKLDVKFNTEVQVHALKLQGDSDQSQTVRIIPLVRDRSTQIYTDVLDSSGKPLIVEATLNGRRPVTAILPTPVTRIEELRLEILSIDTEDSGSLRVDFLGCMEVVTTTTQTSTSTTIVEATLNGRRPVTAILPTPVTRIEELRLEILSIDTEDSGSLRVDFLGCMEEITTTTPAATTTKDQSTDINADKPWTFELQSNPEDNRDQNPKLDVKFNTEVQVHALKLQGDSDQSQTVRIISLVRDRSTQIYTDVLDSSGKPLIVEATLNGRRPVTAILPTPVTRIEELRLEILSIDTEDSEVCVLISWVAWKDTVWSQWTASKDLRVAVLQLQRLKLSQLISTLINLGHSSYSPILRTTATKTPKLDVKFNTEVLIVEATLNGRRPVTAILPTPVTRIEELRLEILSFDTEDSGSLRVDFLGCMEEITTTTPAATTTKGYCMEAMDGEQGLESSRSTTPASEDQSTDINADKPWTFELQSNPEDNRDQNPKLNVQFNTKVEVHA